MNESASGKLAHLEKQVQQLQEENQLLQRSNEDTGRDLREDNALLKEQVNETSYCGCKSTVISLGCIYGRLITIYNLMTFQSCILHFDIL